MARSTRRVRTRPPRPEELPALLAMHEDFYRLEGIPWNRGRTLRAVRRLLRDPSLGWVAVFEVGGELAGYAVVTFGYDLEFGGRDAFVTELYLRPELRGRGLGTEAMERLERRAATRGVRALHLFVDWRNTAAQRLYEKRGFVLSPRRLMTKLLID